MDGDMAEIIAIAILLAGIIGIWLLLARMTEKPSPGPDHEASLQELEALKGGRIWGDFPQADPRRPLTKRD